MKEERKRSIFKNKHWEYGGNIRVSVVTAVYNMADVMPRAVESVERQSYRDIEYIIVDDGSTDGIDQVVFPFMERASIPVMYIKKENGGVHTARNAAHCHMRGEFCIGIDADDELVADAVQTCLNIWDAIPEAERYKYKGVVGRTVDIEGNMIGAAFPDYINDLPTEQLNSIISKINAEFESMILVRILKDHPMPEPEGVTFVTENIRWGRLNKIYRSYYVNDILRIYHTESDNSITRSRKRTVQNVINNRWNDAFFLNHWDLYPYSRMERIRFLAHYSVMEQILRMKHGGQYQKCPLAKRNDRLICHFFYVPSVLAAMRYIHKKMKL